jgi:hypothetical protein
MDIVNQLLSGIPPLNDEQRAELRIKRFTDDLDRVLIRGHKDGLCLPSMISLMADRISVMSLAAGHADQQEIPLAEVLAELPL